MGEGPFKDFVCPVTLRRSQVESASRSIATRRLPLRTPDAIAHVSVGRIENAGLGKIPQILFVFFNLLIAAGKVQRHLRHVVHIAVANVPNLQSFGFRALLPANEIFGGRLVASAWNVDVLNTQLLRKLQILVARICWHLKRKLDAWR
jgi:hypothetical protein